MSTLVMAIIAITVLLVVILIFVSNMKKPTGEIRGVSEGISLTGCTDVKDSITGKVYSCHTGPVCPGSDDHAFLRDASCKKEGKDICCAKSTEKPNE